MKSVMEILEEEIINIDKFHSQDGLLKNKIIEAGLKLDEDILEVIIKNEVLCNTFTKEVAGIKIFDKVKFQNVINNKNFLPDSYTIFKNKLGLEDYNGTPIHRKKDVVLTWAYKDCILEGGQSKDEKNRKEIFYNEILAPELRDRIMQPKVLTNFRRYTQTGIEQDVKEIDFENENLIIKGNNLLALSSINKRYNGQAKLIIIDPPYNIGDETFKYNDSFNHSTWLTFMSNRLKEAKDLLAENGLIFVNINTSRNNKGSNIGAPEFAYLNILMDEIFGRENFITQLHWKKKKQPSYLSKVAGVMESILVYAKNESYVGKLILGETTDKTKKIDNATNNISERYIYKGIKYKGESNCVIRRGTYKNKTMTTEFLDDVVVKDGIVQNDFRAIAKFLNTQDEINRFCEEDLIYITKNNSFRRLKDEKELASGKSITDLLLDWGQNQDATEELKVLFDIDGTDKVFDTPKPELLIHNIIACCTDEDDLVVDFFLGSGTTIAVAHKMNRRYIGIEQMNYIESVTVERMNKVIQGEQGGISKLVKWTGGGSFVYCELMELNQRYIDSIRNCSKDEELLQLWEVIKGDQFLNYKIDSKLIEENFNDFKEASFDEKSTFLVEILDKNMLYVNYCDMNDEDYNLSKKDKKINKSFYQGV